jgi:hypothetical protein
MEMKRMISLVLSPAQAYFSSVFRESAHFRRMYKNRLCRRRFLALPWPAPWLSETSLTNGAVSLQVTAIRGPVLPMHRLRYWKLTVTVFAAWPSVVITRFTTPAPARLAGSGPTLIWSIPG